MVDQSMGREAMDVVQELEHARLRVVRDEGRGTARATNRGLHEATHDLVLVTHDDCTVASDWFGIAFRLARARPNAILTGRVLAPEGSIYVPSTKSSCDPEDFTGRLITGGLFPNNMALPRSSVIELGGFDEREGLRWAEDNDLCYRWLRDGRPLCYEPELVVWHQDWRPPVRLVQTHIRYARSEGVFYAKHIYAGDWEILPVLWRELRDALRTLATGVLRSRPRWCDPQREMLLHLPIGFVQGWSEARRLGRTRS